jgi:hypothetical protein
METNNAYFSNAFWTNKQTPAKLRVDCFDRNKIEHSFTKTNLLVLFNFVDAMRGQESCGEPKLWKVLKLFELLLVTFWLHMA